MASLEPEADVQLAAEAADRQNAATTQSSSQHEMPGLAAEDPAEDAGGERVAAGACDEARCCNREIRSISRSHLDCIICRELMAEVHALHCGHMFCGLCLAHWLNRKKDCPSCRTAVTGPIGPGGLMEGLEMAEAPGHAPASPGQQQDAQKRQHEKPPVQPRSYQKDLIDVAARNNVIISLATGAGKTMIAAEVIRRRLPDLKAAGKAVCFMAPTNPLVEQQCVEALGRTHGFRARAYHGSKNNQRLSSWTRTKWEAVLAEVDVLVMTPDVLLHTLSRGVFQDGRRRKGKPLHPGLQWNLNSRLITVPDEGPLRCELDAAVPRPSSHILSFMALPAEGVMADSLAWLNCTKEQLLKPAKSWSITGKSYLELAGQALRLGALGLCGILLLLQQQVLQEMWARKPAGLTAGCFEGFAEGGRVAALDKQLAGLGIAEAGQQQGPGQGQGQGQEDDEAQDGSEAERLGNEWSEDDGDSGSGEATGFAGDTSRMYDDIGVSSDLLLAELRFVGRGC
eukprot:gene10973-11128_t